MICFHITLLLQCTCIKHKSLRAWEGSQFLQQSPQAGNTGFLMGSAPPNELLCPLAPIHVQSKFLPMLTLVIDTTFEHLESHTQLNREKKHSAICVITYRPHYGVK